MFNLVTESIKWNGEKIKLQTGKIARQSNASVLVQMGKSLVLCTITFNKKLKEGIDFLPLSINYIEKYYAAGKFPGGFFKREGKPSEKEILTSRLIDRSLRPCFPENFLHEVNVVCQVLSHDRSFSPDILSIIGTIAALKISDVPFNKTLSAIRIGLIGNEFIFNPSRKELEKSKLDLVISGTSNSILMIESEGQEIDKKQIYFAIKNAHQNIKGIIQLIDNFNNYFQLNKCYYTKLDIKTASENLRKEYYQDMQGAYKMFNKKIRNEMLDILYNKAIDTYLLNKETKINIFNLAYKSFKKKILRNNIIKNNLRIDGRNFKTIRAISCEINLLPSAHGSSLFTRGETQSLSTVTLGSQQDMQLIDNVTSNFNSRFMLHYNFFPYSVGEVGSIRHPSRREIGHGKLAFKAINCILPSYENFPYTIRIVSEITESNGSSSMATICASTLALINANVPIKTSAAGIAMGLIMEKKRYVILSDIIEEEDLSGDMDFKISFTKNGITALQMDVKSDIITAEIINKVICQAQSGCNFILSKINKSISFIKKSLNSSVPRIKSIKINKDKIKNLIGLRGGNIKSISNQTGVKIDIENNGNVKIFAFDKISLQNSLDKIDQYTILPEMGKVYPAKIIKIMQFGAFVKFLGSIEALIHINEMKNIPNINNVFSEGMNINIQYIGLDYKNKIKVTIKNIRQIK